ncbi:MAG: M28 family peptidase [Acidobacteriota bacterium]
MQSLKVISVGLISLFLMHGGTLAQIPEGYEKGLSTISKKEILNTISVLAADSMKGRPAGSRENLVAANYIASKFRQYGLKPLFAGTKKIAHKYDENEDRNNLLISEDSSLNDVYYQKFVIKKSRLSDNNSLVLSRNFTKASYRLSYKYLSDFLIQYSVPENLSLSAPVVFAGYGIDKGENGYSDYVDKNGKSLDVKNKIVLIVDGFPQEGDTSSLFSKSRNVLYRNPLRKAELAEEKGALAVIVVSSPFKNEPPLTIKYEKLLHSFQREIFSLPGMERKGIPVIYASGKILKDLFGGISKNLKGCLENIDKTLKAESFEIEDKTMSLEISFDEELLKTQNVGGIVEGSDPVLKDEFVVIGAHYDHIGLGYYGTGNRSNEGKIHNGADDNASGVSGMLEIAEAFSKSPAKRSILFLAFSGEESGILGSKYYVSAQPIKPLEKTVAMLNLDMISRNEKNELFLGGAFYSKDIIRIAERANEHLSMNLFYNTGLYTSASDQGPFLKKKIPSLFFFSGIHEDFHMPTDDLEKVDVEKAETVSKLAYLTAWITGNESVKPAYQEVTMNERMEIVRESMRRQGNGRKSN